jgi:hypothetical protein
VESLSDHDPLSESYAEAKAAHDREFRDMHDLIIGSIASGLTSSGNCLVISTI